MLKIMNYIKNSFKYFISIFSQESQRFQLFNNKNVENSNVLYNRPNIYDHLYIFSDPDKIFKTLDNSKYCYPYPLSFSGDNFNFLGGKYEI